MGMWKHSIHTNEIEHIENPLADVRVGVPLFTPTTRSVDHEIEQMVQQIIDGDVSDVQVQPANDVVPPDENAEPLRWPTQDHDNPVNEYQTEGYITMTFPCLFPYGRADFRDESERTESLGVAEYFDALIRYKDGRFGNHPRCISIVSSSSV
jgi:hypothetical protein